MGESREQLWWDPEVVVVPPRRAPPAPPRPLPTLPTPLAGTEPEPRTRRTWLLVAGVVLILAAIGLALGLVLTLGRSSPDHGAFGALGGTGGSVPRAASANVSLADLPPGWTPDRSPSAPLLGFLSYHGVARDPSSLRQGALIARQFESCLGVSARADAIFGTTSPPLAEVGSVPFDGPAGGPELETGSLTTLYRSPAPVRQAASQLRDRRFGPCFGTALGQELLAGARQAGTGRSPNGRASAPDGSGVTFGSPTSAVLGVPVVHGTTAAGVEVSLPFTAAGVPHEVGLGMVLVAGGRLESTLVTFSGPSGFPPLLTAELAAAIEHRVAPPGRPSSAVEASFPGLDRRRAPSPLLGR